MIPSQPRSDALPIETPEAPTLTEAPEFLAALSVAAPDALGGFGEGAPATTPAPTPTVIETASPHGWARWLVPSLSDFFFLAMIGWLFVGPKMDGWKGLLGDADAGWHIRTGEYILDHLTVPYQDLYSFSKPGQSWYAWEWGADVIDGLLFRWAGLKGVTLAAGLILAFFATTLVKRMVWRGTNLLVALLVSFLCVSAASLHFLARPHIYTLLLASLSVWMIESDRARASKRIWWLVPLTALWTNLHGGFLALVAVLGLTAVGTAVEAWLGSGRTVRDALRYLKLTVACALASLVNPYGWNLHVHIIEYMQSDWIRNAVQEFQSPAFRNEVMLHFEILMLAGILVCATMFRRRQIVEGLWILFWVHMALSSVRHVPVFVAIAGPVIAWEVSCLWQAYTARSKKSSVTGILNQMAGEAAGGFKRTSLLPWAAVAVLAAMGEPMIWPKDFPADSFPTKIVHDHLDLIAQSRVLTTDQWGDYLIFTNPEQKVYIDGRSDFYGPEVGKEYIGVLAGEWNWREVMAKRDFNLVLLSTTDAIVQLLKQEPSWRVVVDDGKRILLARR